MGKGQVYQQQCYGDNGMRMDTQAQQQSYAFHDESWGSDNTNHNQFPGMHMKPSGAFAMEHELSMPKHHGQYGMSRGASKPGYYAHGGGKRHVFGDTDNAPYMFSNGGVKFYHGGQHHGYNYSEESEYEAYSEEHHGGAAMKMDEMRYERHNYGPGDHGYYANPYDVRMKPLGGHTVEWTPKGV